jgi:hypothetical protein
MKDTVKDTKAINEISKFLNIPKTMLSEDDGSVHLNLDDTFNPRSVVAALESDGWADKWTTDGYQLGCVCVHQKSTGFFYMMND